MLQAPVLPPLSYLVTALANDLDRLADQADPAGRPVLPDGQRFILVLDDYHLIREPAIHELLGDLLRHPPRTLHLVISARLDPPFLPHSARSRGDFSELRVAELRFTREEAAGFMQQMLETPLDDETIASVVERTEGWGTGLRLATLALNSGVEAPGPITGDRYTSDYLIAEVLSHVPAVTQDFLLKTSILDRLCGSLCDTVAAPTDPAWDGRAYLEWLAAENIFTFSLDSQANWYRYHHLFQRLLRAQLERQRRKDEIASLHTRASAWFEEHGHIEEAIQHALSAGDESLAVRIVESHRHEAMNRSQWRQLEQWRNLLPRRLIDTRPELLTLEAWLIQNAWRLSDIPAHLDRIEALMQQDPSEEEDCVWLAAEVDTLRSLACFYLLDSRSSFFFARRALEHTPLERSFCRGAAWMYLAAGYYMNGDAPQALDAIYEGLKEDSAHGNAFPTRLYVTLCQVRFMQADPVNLMLAASQMLQLGRQRNLSEATHWAHYFRGVALYQQNELAKAEAEFHAGSRRHLAHGFAFSQSAFGLAAVRAARNEWDEARSIVDSVATYALEMNNSRIMADAEAWRTYSDCAQARWPRRNGGRPHSTRPRPWCR